jgi:hypothetical protein
LLLPDDVLPGPKGWQTPASRDFTIVGSFGATVQATFLASCVSRHILDTNRDLATRANDARKLDIALQSFVGSCIPPPYVFSKPTVEQSNIALGGSPMVFTVVPLQSGHGE